MQLLLLLVLVTSKPLMFSAAGSVKHILVFHKVLQEIFRFSEITTSGAPISPGFSQSWQTFSRRCVGASWRRYGPAPPDSTSCPALLPAPSSQQQPWCLDPGHPDGRASSNCGLALLPLPDGGGRLRWRERVQHSWRSFEIISRYLQCWS